MPVIQRAIIETMASNRTPSPSAARARSGLEGFGAAFLHERIEADREKVRAGLKNAESLFLIPAEIVHQAVVKFPDEVEAGTW